MYYCDTYHLFLLYLLLLLQAVFWRCSSYLEDKVKEEVL